MAVVELAFAGYWFFGAADDAERASLFASWGLLDTAPQEAPVVTSETPGLTRFGTGTSQA